jgi:hypothetical protein
MKLAIAVIAALAPLAAFAAGVARAGPPPDRCDVPQSLIDADFTLSRAMNEIKDHHRLYITVVGSGSSGLPGPDGAHSAYPARLENVLKERVAGVDIKVTAHVQSKETTATMVSELSKILADDKPELVIWQAGTVDALNGVAPDDFKSSLIDGVEKIHAAGADLILMNMQYSPHTESMLDVSAYADIMRVVADEQSALLFDRFAIMHYWNEDGAFDLYTATKKYDMARRVHGCIGWALASQIIAAAHIDAANIDAKRMQTTR